MTANHSFDEFVRRQQEHAAANAGFDYQAEKEQYLSKLSDLYSLVRSYLRQHIENGSIKIQDSVLHLDEEGVGPYAAPQMTIIIGQQYINLTPIGTMLIGSAGRVDVVGSIGKARLTLVDKHINDARSLIKVTLNPVRAGQKVREPTTPGTPKKIEWTWKIVTSPPSTAFIDLTKESFLTMIVEVSGG